METKIQLCEYGCNQEALYQLKNGKRCCSKPYNLCPELRKKNKGNNIIGAERKGGLKKGCTAWNKGLLLKNNDKYKAQYKKMGEKLSNRYKNGELIPSQLGVVQTDEFCKNRSEDMDKRYASGWTATAGRCKKIKYHSLIAGDITVDGTWELRVAKWLDNNNYTWHRNKKRFAYFNKFREKISHYTPDFYIEEWKSYLEIKGYETELDRCKWSQFKEPLIIWKKEEMKNIP